MFSYPQGKIYVLGDIWKNLPSLYEKGKPYIASLAPWVEECAVMGDRTSTEILENNAERLALLIKAARANHGAPDSLICAGGFFKSLPQIGDPGKNRRKCRKMQ